MRTALVIVLLGLAGCGGPNWAGTYSGQATQSGSCSDGSALPSSGGTISFTITQSGDNISWAAACGATANGKVNGNTATISQYSCPAQTANGYTVTQTVTGGTLTLNGNSMQVSFSFTEAITSTSGSGTCTGTITGTLALQSS